MADSAFRAEVAMCDLKMCGVLVKIMSPLCQIIVRSRSLLKAFIFFSILWNFFLNKQN